MDLQLSKSPYINTVLYTQVSLFPNQMNNNLYINLKKNLEKMIKFKCFEHYGYIQDIFEIIDYKYNSIPAENFLASAVYNISFSCRLCLPLKGMQIICKIQKINKHLFTASNGPILVIVTKERINDKNFFNDSNNNIRFSTDDNKSQLLKSVHFVKLTLDTITFENGDDKIKAIGFLDNIATDEEIKNFYHDLYSKDSEFIDFDSHNISES